MTRHADEAWMVWLTVRDMAKRARYEKERWLWQLKALDDFQRWFNEMRKVKV